MIMNKFDRQLKIIEEDIFEGASSEEVKERQEKGREIELKERLDEIKSRSKVNEDGSLDVDGNVWLDELELTKIPLKFNKVNGCFSCSSNKLTSLEGCPKEVIGNFDCSTNFKLTSLKGCPEKVYGNFNCLNTSLTSLEGCPKEVGGDFTCNGRIIKKYTKDEIKSFCKIRGFIYIL